MDLSDAIRRVLYRHRGLIMVLMGSFAALFFALAASRTGTFNASSRLVLTSPEPGDVEAAASIADSAEAIASSPGIVAAALEEGNIDRVASRVAKAVSVDPIGSSGILQLTVSDQDPEVAADIANALTERLVHDWGSTSGNDPGVAIAQLQQRIADLEADMNTVEGNLERVGADLEVTTDPANRGRLLALQSDLTKQRDSLQQQRVIYQSQVAALFVEQVTQAPPRIIDRATRPTERDGTNPAPATALGALLGLFIGLGIAAAIETYRPSLVGADAVADALDTPVLGLLSDPDDLRQRGWASLQTQLAAAAAGAETVEVIPVGREVPRGILDVLSFNGKGGTAGPSVAVFGTNGTVELARKGNPHVGLIVVTPHVVRRSDLRSIQDLRTVTSWPLLGIVAFTPGWVRATAAAAALRRSGD